MTKPTNRPNADNLPPDIREGLEEEPLRRRMQRALGRLANRMYAHPVELQDINRIKMPKAADGTRYFAARNARGNWNVIARTGELRGGAPHTLCDTVIGLDLGIHAALDLLAAKHPEGLKKYNGSTSHPVYIAARIGHRFAAPETPAPAAEKPAVPKPRKNGGFSL